MNELFDDDIEPPATYCEWCEAFPPELSWSPDGQYLLCGECQKMAQRQHDGMIAAILKEMKP